MYLLLIACIVGTALGQGTLDHIPTRQEIEHYLKLSFHQVDENHNGYLEINELRGVYLFEDANGDGKLTLAEYEQVVPIPHAMAEKTFNYFDYTGRGYIPIDAMFDHFSQIDANDDGLISEPEYLAYELDTMQKIYGFPN